MTEVIRSKFSAVIQAVWLFRACLTASILVFAGCPSRPEWAGVSPFPAYDYCLEKIYVVAYPKP